MLDLDDVPKVLGFKTIGLDNASTEEMAVFKQMDVDAAAESAINGNALVVTAVRIELMVVMVDISMDVLAATIEQNDLELVLTRIVNYGKTTAAIGAFKTITAVESSANRAVLQRSASMAEGEILASDT